MSIPKDGYIGEPGYPAPWTTRTPREGLRDTDQARIISLSPDVCRSPKTPIPYPVVDFCGHDQNYTPSVRFTGQKAMVMRSNTSHVHGDEAGRGRGVVSNTVGGISEPITHAAEVRAEGSHVIRHLDRFWMNNRNTVGEAVFVRDTAIYAAPQDDDPLPGSMVATAMPFEPYQVTQAATGTVSDAGGWGRTAPQPPPQTQSRPQSGTGLGRRGLFGRTLLVGLADALTGGGVSRTQIETVLAELDYYTATPDRGLDADGMNVFAQAAALVREQALPANDIALAQDIRARVPEVLAFDPGDDLRGLTDDQIRDRLLGRVEVAAPAPEEPEPEEEEPTPLSPLGPAVTVRITEREEYRRRCQVDRYAVMRHICGQYGMQAHHIVPDWTLRYGTRGEADKRIPNMPSLNDGMAICVMGYATQRDSEHYEAHFADGAIETLGENSTPAYTAILMSVAAASVTAMKAVRPDCAAQIDAAMLRQFSGNNPYQLLRAKRLPPLPQETIHALQSGASRPIR